MSNNKNLNRAKKEKNDEFYTKIEDIENELKHYNKYFKNKVIYCNCDGEESNFYKYFINNFEKLRLKKLICSKYNSDNYGDYIEYNGKEIVKYKMKENGDFRSKECIDILKKSDIIITNPPFSLFRDFIDILMKYDKKFLVVGNNNACGYSNIFPLIKENKIWLGYTRNKTLEFQIPPTYKFKEGKYRKDEKGNCYVKVQSISWFTNLPVNKNNNELILTKHYNPKDYPKYINYPAFNIDKVSDIPIDEYIITYINKDEKNDFQNIYKDDLEILEENDKIKVKINNLIYGVPITFLCKYNPEKYEIIGISKTSSITYTKNIKMEILKDGKPTGKYVSNAKSNLFILFDKNKHKYPGYRDIKTGELYVGLYARLLIRRK